MTLDEAIEHYYKQASENSTEENMRLLDWLMELNILREVQRNIIERDNFYYKIIRTAALMHLSDAKICGSKDCPMANGGDCEAEKCENKIIKLWAKAVRGEKTNDEQRRLIRAHEE